MARILAAAREIFLEAAENLHPAYFALAMATGIIAIAINALISVEVAKGLFWLNIFLYLALWLLTLTRILLFKQRFLADLFSHQLGPGFFTVAAASGVVGSGLILIMNNHSLAMVFWVLTFLLWLGLTYSIFVGLIVKENKPTIAEGINGGWLTAIVATQSVASLTALLASRFGPYQQEMLFFSLVTWLFGGMLYIWIISLIFYRYTFFKFAPQDLTPPYWINMGAVAITTMVGAILVSRAEGSSFLSELLPFLKGFTLFFWATSTWWIPMLVILGIWRHVYRKFPVEYSCLYWGAVFPLGMYTISTYLLSQANGLPFVGMIPKYFVYVAMAAWSITFIGLGNTAFRKMSVAFRSVGQTKRHISYSDTAVPAQNSAK
ncbi:MAG: tellurite resistance/C4-dicarboxylate transporter family protein [Chloroflexi bacterium]|nr:tellurite resistance/C4-dicarboxylate transporter family protein [Chloroflexota bacterium]